MFLFYNGETGSENCSGEFGLQTAAVRPLIAKYTKLPKSQNKTPLLRVVGRRWSVVEMSLERRWNVVSRFLMGCRVATTSLF